MSCQRFDVRGLGDQLILEQIEKLNQTSAEVMADLLCRLAEVDRRRLYAPEGCCSLFGYAVEKLGCSEDEAARRIHAARAGGRFPVVFDLVASGELTLTAVSRLSKHLTEANHLAVLALAKGKTLREIDELIARLAPKPDVAPRLARLPGRCLVVPEVATPSPATAPVESATPTSVGATSPAATDTSTLAASDAARTVNPAPATAANTFALSAPPVPPAGSPGAAGGRLASRTDRSRVEPLSPERWALRVTIGAAARRALLRAQDLSNPWRDEAAIVEQALIEYAERLESRKHATLLRRGTPASAGQTARRERKRPDDPKGSGNSSKAVGRGAAPTSGATTSGATTGGATTGGATTSGATTSGATTGGATTSGATTSGASARGAAAARRAPAGSEITSAGADAQASRTEARASDRRANLPARQVTDESRGDPTSATDTALHVAKHVRERRSGRAGDRDHGRRPSRAIRREVWERDGGRCTFEGPDGRRCSATARLEYHHLRAWALGGETTAAGLTLRCRAHNLHEAVLDFGAAHMAEAVERRRRGSRPRPPEHAQPVG